MVRDGCVGPDHRLAIDGRTDGHVLTDRQAQLVRDRKAVHAGRVRYARAVYELECTPLILMERRLRLKGAEPVQQRSRAHQPHHKCHDDLGVRECKGVVHILQKPVHVCEWTRDYARDPGAQQKGGHR